MAKTTPSKTRKSSAPPNWDPVAVIRQAHDRIAGIVNDDDTHETLSAHIEDEFTQRDRVLLETGGIIDYENFNGNYRTDWRRQAVRAGSEYAAVKRNRHWLSEHGNIKAAEARIQETWEKLNKFRQSLGETDFENPTDEELQAMSRVQSTHRKLEQDHRVAHRQRALIDSNRDTIHKLSPRIVRDYAMRLARKSRSEADRFWLSYYESDEIVPAAVYAAL